jgi:hypothetical protein
MMCGGSFSSSVKELTGEVGGWKSSLASESSNSALPPVFSDASPCLDGLSCSDPLLDQKYSSGVREVRKESCFLEGVGKGETLPVWWEVRGSWLLVELEIVASVCA